MQVVDLDRVQWRAVKELFRFQCAMEIAFEVLLPVAQAAAIAHRIFVFDPNKLRP
jgi:hypothetical protein